MHPNRDKQWTLGAWFVGAWSLAGPWLFAILLLLMPRASDAGLDAGTWPMFHRDARHRGFVFQTGPLSGNIAWTAPLSDAIEYSSPVVTSQWRIFIGDATDRLWCVNFFGGTLWNYNTSGNLRYGTPAVAADGTIYVGDADGNVYAVFQSGLTRWVRPLGSPVKTAPAIGDNGTVYVGADNGRLYALSPATGAVLWSFPATDTIRSSPAIGPDGMIYFGSHDGYIRALYPNGILRWSGATGGPIKAAPAVFRDRVIVASTDGFIYYIDRVTGALEWATYTGHYLRSSPAIGRTGKIYLGIGDNIACFHDSGEPSYEFITEGRIYSSPAVTAGADSIDVVICGSDDGNLYAVKNGVELWRADLGAPVRSSPAIGPGGYIFVGTMDGGLYAFSDLNPSQVISADDLQQLRLVFGPNPSVGGRDITIHLIGQVSGDLAGESSMRQGSLTVLDLLGREVRSLSLRLGETTIWDGRDASGRSVASGVYWVVWNDGTNRISGRVARLR